MDWNIVNITVDRLSTLLDMASIMGSLTERFAGLLINPWLGRLDITGAEASALVREFQRCIRQPKKRILQIVCTIQSSKIVCKRPFVTGKCSDIAGAVAGVAQW